ncbi:protein SRG1-like isoform X2 [Vitis riparia]|uniref:protein SRG1-like isoform X2 n=1 Tax=Vitis riparia TaxID=96939 RepID=UPI00155B2EBF|nr:protein SRG1-like isoform X2 [Vitis riparia]
MAGSPVATVVPPLAQSVQEMSVNGNEPPPQYFLKENSIQPMDSFLPSDPIPIIDISLLSSSSLSSKGGEEELQKLKSTLTSWGCFQAVGHGLSSSFLDKVREVGKQFFALPVEEKEKYSRATDGIEGYGNDPILSENQVLDWSYRLFLRLQPVDQRKLRLWPENPTEFREVLDEYGTKVKIIMDVLLKAMAKSLNLEENSFSSQFGERAVMQTRFNFYLSCPRPDLVLGVKPHSDRSGITVLLQDKEVEGLQVFKDDKWFKVPVIPHALVVNLGDQMQIMSNGIFKSPIHRVVTNSERMRISVAMFNEPEPEKEIGPVEGLIDEKRPRLYRDVKNYASFNFECFQKGVVPLESAKI